MNTIIGAVCYMGFVLLRGFKDFSFYEARLHLPNVSHKPPAMRLRGLSRLYSWLVPVFKVTDEEFVLSAGLDALVAVRIISFGVMLFLPMTLLAMAILIPINYTSDWYQYEASQNVDVQDECESRCGRAVWGGREAGVQAHRPATH